MGLAARLVSNVHEGKFGQNLGREFQVLQVVKREVRTCFILRKAFAADLDDPKHIAESYLRPALRIVRG